MQFDFLSRFLWGAPRRDIMANCDFFDPTDVRESHGTNERAGGERDYIRHVRSHMLSAGERLVLFLAIAVLTGVALGGHFSPPRQAERPAPIESQMANSQPLSAEGAWHYHPRCREDSPFSERSC
jgi:hypothetical protein